MNRFQKTFTSSVGAKALMAVTGLSLLGFVVVHMLGNLQVFAGQEVTADGMLAAQDKLNAYAAALKSLGPGLWGARIGLLGVFLLHVVSAARLVSLNRKARPVRYVSAKPQVTSFAARTMWMSGLIVLAFVAYHLAHFTFGVTHPEHYALTDAAGRHDVYSMVVLGFRDPVVAGLYAVAQVLLALHIAHGASSAFHTLGVTHPSLGFLKAGFGRLVAAVILLGNLAIPLAILLGFVGLPEGVR